MTRALAASLGLEVLELDALRHQPGWVPMPDEECRSRVAAFTAGERWIVDGNYFDVVTRDLVWPRADAIVWLDLPRSLVIRRLLRRTLRRAFRREVLGNGNREQLRNIFRLDDRNIVRYAWTSQGERRARFEEGLVGLDAELARLRTPTAVKAFLRGVQEGGE